MSDGVQVREASGVVLIYGISLQASALHLCRRFQERGVTASIGMLPGVRGYQVVVHELSVQSVVENLAEFGMKSEPG
ncbi:MAG TPA: hypothetical protein VHA37_08955 [Candidatus Saccharimonadales bacterium]|nr:hypothetical protein [Candidatus Saccharimonadales bacterium]